MFSEIDPFESGMLEVGEAEALYWECCGNPDGSPALVLHGGPGSGCSSFTRRLFDPHAYRVVQFDQRGCGRSVPRVEATTDLLTNTTDHLVADIEVLRQHLGIERWVVQGTSWGVTLGLVYAEAHPDRVVALALASVTMTRRSDIDWLYHGVGRFYPQEWQRFRNGVAPQERDGDLVRAYHRLLHEQPDLEERQAAAAAWCAWEDALAPLPGGGPNPRYADPAFRMTFARIVTHYFRHAAWLEEDQILDSALCLSDIPAWLIHGRRDLGGPVDGARQLFRAWPGAELIVVDEGHTGGRAMTAAIVEATERFKVMD